MKGTYAFLKSLSRFSCRLSPQGAERMGRILGLIFWTLVPPKRNSWQKKISSARESRKTKRSAENCTGIIPPFRAHGCGYVPLSAAGQP